MAYLSSLDFTGNTANMTWWNRIRMNLFLNACGEVPGTFFYFSDKASLPRNEFNKKWGHLAQYYTRDEFAALQERLNKNQRLFNQFYKSSYDYGEFKEVNVLAACFKAAFADTGWGRLRWLYKWLTVPLTLLTELVVSAVSETFLSINIGLNNLKPSGEGMFGAALLNVWKVAKGFIWGLGEIADAIADVFRPAFWTHDNLIHPVEHHFRSTVRISSVSEDVDYAMTRIKTGFNNLFKQTEKPQAATTAQSTDIKATMTTPQKDKTQTSLNTSLWNQFKMRHPVGFSNKLHEAAKHPVEIEMQTLPTRKVH